MSQIKQGIAKYFIPMQLSKCFLVDPVPLSTGNVIVHSKQKNLKKPDYFHKPCVNSH